MAAEDARRAFDADPAKYTRPERARFAYAVVLARDFQPAAPASEAELLSYYEQNPAEFKTERAVHARHILFRLAEGAAPEEEKKIRERAQFVLGKAKAGTDFAALAREFSQDPSGPAGGDLGWFSAGQMDPAFEQAAFALGKGQVSDLVRTQFGFHIIKVEETREAGTPTFEQARAEVARKHAAAAARAAVVEPRRADQRRARGRRARDGRGDIRPDRAHDRAGAARGAAPRTRVPVRCRRIPVRPRRGRDQRTAAPGGRLLGVQDAGQAGCRRAVVRGGTRRRGARPAGRAGPGSAPSARGGCGSRICAGASSSQSIAARGKGEVRETAFFTQRDFVAEAGIKGELLQGAFAWASARSAGRSPPRTAGSSSTGSTAGFRRRARRSSPRRTPSSTRLRSAKRDQFFEAWMEDLRRVRAVKINEALVGKL